MLQAQNADHSLMQSITALPEPLLEKILLSAEEKKALRQTCKCFQQILDNNLVCIQLQMHQDKRQEKFMKRMQHMPHVTAVGLRTVDSISTRDLCSLLSYLPKQLISLNFYGQDDDFYASELAKLPCLTDLCIEGAHGQIIGIEGAHGQVIGIEYISGLTRLQCDKPIGSLAHLAPTLKHLSIGDYTHVREMNQLTNLEFLKMCQSVPVEFFQIHRQLPLKHLHLVQRSRFGYQPLLQSSEAWESAPPTLTCVTLSGLDSYMTHWLPPSITHLQVLSCKQDAVRQIATALPGLCSLNMRFDLPWDLEESSRSLSMLTNLQSLCIRLHDAVPQLPFDWKKYMAPPGLAEAVARGVDLKVVMTSKELKDVPQPTRSTAWVTPT